MCLRRVFKFLHATGCIPCVHHRRAVKILHRLAVLLPQWAKGVVIEVDHECAQLSRLEAVVVASPKSPLLLDTAPMVSQPQTPAGCLLASVEGTTACLETPLQSPPFLGDPPPPRGGDRRAQWGDISRGWGGGYLPTCYNLRQIWSIKEVGFV